MSKKYKYIYQTTNLINGKIYIGQHKTNNLEDNYLGSGKVLNYAIEKYGKENFKQEIIVFCNSQNLLDKIEKMIVNKTFINQDKEKNELIKTTKIN